MKKINMKILIVLLRWNGGVGTVVKYIKSELEKRGKEVISISREEDLKCFSSVKNLFWLRKKYKSVIKKENPDIIYTQDWSMALPLIFPFRVFQKKHFCCFHGNQIGKAKIIQFFVGKTLGKRLIVVGDSLKERFTKSNLVYNGVDLEMFKPLGKKRSCLGWINKETEIQEEEEVISLAKKMKLKPLIAKNFSISFDKMSENFYNRCKIFISLPPREAGFNLCWVEAMASGVPIIIGNKEGIGCKLNINKFENKEELFKKIKSLKPKDYRKEIEKSDLTWKSHVNKLLEIWEEKWKKKFTG